MTFFYDKIDIELVKQIKENFPPLKLTLDNEYKTLEIDECELGWEHFNRTFKWEKKTF